MGLGLFALHWALEGVTGMVGLVGMFAGTREGGVLFGNPGTALERNLMGHAYFLLATAASIPYLLMWWTKAGMKKNFELLLALSFGGLVYHFLTASFVLGALFDPSEPGIPIPSKQLVLGMLRDLDGVVPYVENVQHALEGLSDWELRIGGGGIAACLHLVLGIGFVRLIVDVNDEWTEEVEKEEGK